MPGEVGPFPAKSAVDEMAEQVAADIKGSCLPESWTIRKRRDSDNELHIEFESSDVGPTVEVRTSGSYDGTWDLKLDVDGP
jgi:hypothetical protein